MTVRVPATPTSTSIPIAIPVPVQPVAGTRFDRVGLRFDPEHRAWGRGAVAVRPPAAA